MIRRRAPLRGAQLATAALALAGLILLPSARGAPGQATAAGSAEADTSIDVTIVGDPATLRWGLSLVGPRSLKGAVLRMSRAQSFNPRELLGATAARGGAAPSLRCWLDLSDRRRARLYFASRSGERFLIRDLQLSGRLDAIDRELVAEVLELSVAALLEDERAGLTRAEAEAALAARDRPTPPGAPPARAEANEAARPVAAGVTGPTAVAQATGAARAAERAPATPAADPETAGSAAGATTAADIAAGAGPDGSNAASRATAPFSVTVGILYAAQAFSSELPIAHGPGLTATFGQPLERRRWAGWLSAAYQWPETEQQPAIGLRLETVVLRAGLELARGLAPARGSSNGPPAAGNAPRFAHLLTARLGAGVDAVRVSPQPGSGDPPASLTPGRWSPALALTAGIGDAVPLGRRGYLAVRLFADLFPIAVDYQASIDGRLQTTFSTWRLRPGLALELGAR